ncbi:RDD family protein [Streptomyces sp. NPDC002088]|uniref:RDD family protein n=1 Tax=Streptomyces sp. NPDC002088 TaxID=3154665 RepID=UPI00333194BA
MSAPTPAPGDDRPREGYYPDPSIPGYVRYWNGASWVPGTSRPTPSDGAPLTPPPGAQPASAPAPAPVEETGPHFFDEDPGQQLPATPAEAQHGSRPEPASAWGADRSRQSGFGGDHDRRVSWGSPQDTDPRVAAAQPDGRSASTDGTATIPPADSGDVPSDGTFVFRRPTAGSGASGAPADRATPGVPRPGGPVGDDGTMTFRKVSPRTAQQDGARTAQRGGASAHTGGAPGTADGSAGATGFGPQGPVGSAGTAGAPGIGAQGSAPSAEGFGAEEFGGEGYGPQGPVGSPASGAGTGRPGFGAGKAAADRAAAAQPQPQPQPQPQQPQPQAEAPAAGAMPMAPMTSGPGGGQPSWPQQVHRLAGVGDDQPVAPWKPPVEDVFQAAARRQAAARPAGLGKRLAARLVDTLVLAAVTSAAAVPLGTKALDHVNEKIDAAKLSGETVTVWLLDGTTSVYLGIVLAVLLVFGVLYEALPTAKWGRTLGKKLLGLEVRDIEGHEPPAFGAALRRWLVYSVPGLLGIGVVGVLWCLFDRPWRQCWHDKAAHTFVAG